MRHRRRRRGRIGGTTDSLVGWLQEGFSSEEGGGEETYGSIDGFIGCHVSIVLEAMVGFAEGYAGEAASDGTCRYISYPSIELR